MSTPMVSSLVSKGISRCGGFKDIFLIFTPTSGNDAN